MNSNDNLNIKRYVKVSKKKNKYKINNYCNDSKYIIRIYLNIKLIINF